MKKVLVVSCFDWYDKRLKYIQKYYESKNCLVQIVLSDFDHISKKRVQANKLIKYCKYINTIPYKKNISLKRIISHLDFSKKVLKIIIKESPDIVYCLTPPNYLVKEISKIKLKRNFKLIFDVIDLWPESMPLDSISNTFIYKKWLNIRNKNIDYADCINLECNFYRKILLKIVDDTKLHTFYITKDIESIEIEQAKENEYNKEIIDVGYLGSINSLIDIEEIVIILDKLSTIKKVRINIIGNGENKDLFLKKLKKANILVKYYGEIYDWRAIEEILRTCYFGINIYKNKLNVGLTIKSIDYFQLGLPILNSIKGDTEEFVRQENIGINIDEFELNKAYFFLDNIVSEKKKIRSFFIENFSSLTILDRLKWLDETI